MKSNTNQRNALNVLFIFGTRPEVIKMAHLIKEIKKYIKCKIKICITAQHREILDEILIFFDINVEKPRGQKKNRSKIFWTNLTFVGNLSVFSFRIHSNASYCYNGSIFQKLIDIQHDKWYQVKLTFECTEGNYSGLGKYHWKALINGTEYNNLGFLNSGAVKNFCLSTVNLDSDYEVYVYNLNFSWAPTLTPEYFIFKYLIFFEHLKYNNITYFVFSEEENQYNQNTEAYIDIENELIAQFYKNKLYEYKYLILYSIN